MSTRLRGRIARSCLSVSSWSLSSNFKALGLRWWGSLTSIFFSDGPLFSRMFAWRSATLVNRSRRVGPKTFVASVRSLKIQAASSCNIQPNSRTPFTKATALLSPTFFGFLFGCSSTFQCGNEHSLPYLQPDSDLSNKHSGGCRQSQGNLVQVPFKKFLHGCRLTPASEAPFSRHTSTSWCWWLKGWSGFWCRFCTLMTVVPENCIGLLSNTVLLSSTCSKLLFSSFNIA